MTIQEIVNRTQDTEPYFFAKKTLKYFGQTLSMFAVEKQPDGRYKIRAGTTGGQAAGSLGGCPVGCETVRYFNPVTNKLDFE